jgi:hypothetical protein
MMPDLDDYRWLVSDAAVPWLTHVAAELAGSNPTPAFVAKLRKQMSPARVHLVFEQIELRARAQEKFSLAGQMFFTRKGLEQATDEQIAAVKAARFPAGEPLADLCCGIGGDLIALTRGAGFPPAISRGVGVSPAIPTRSVCEGALPTCGFDLDPAVAILAQANLHVHECRRSEVHSTDAAAFPVSDVAAWHIDPDRRASGSRTTKVEHYEPPLETLARLLAANPTAAIKLAPAAIVPPQWRDAAERCWYGSRGECRQQVAWFGSLARHPGLHGATIVDAHGGETTIVGRSDEPIPVAEMLGRFLYEPHAAVLAAKLAGALCRETGLAAVSPEVAYLTGPTSGGRESLPGTASPTAMISADKDGGPLLAPFEVVAVLPLDQKQLKSYCREHRIGMLEVKKRGVDIDPERLRKQVVGDGDDAATLIVTPVAGQVRAIVARRVSLPTSVDLAG